jgi:nicotinate-nucleotide pyrophosphorylase (carboxylating)
MRLLPYPSLPPLGQRLQLALLEDCARAGDLTSAALIPASCIAQGVILAKGEGVVCGVRLLEPLFGAAARLLAERDRDFRRLRRTRVAVLRLKPDGARVRPGDRVARLVGPARALLLGERTALNLLGRLSGVATLTARFVRAVAGTKAGIFDTRKTAPLWRDLDKYAVRCGGGHNHRRGLHDMVLIKDNHLELWGACDPAAAVRAAQARFPGLAVEIEVTSLTGLRQVCAGSRPKLVLLDNFTPAGVRQAVAWRRSFFRGRAGRPVLEASGGITLANARALARAGAERLAIGALTHSAPALDLSLEIAPRR